MTILESIGLPTKSYDFCFQGGGGGIGDGVGVMLYGGLCVARGVIMVIDLYVFVFAHTFT